MSSQLLYLPQGWPGGARKPCSWAPAGHTGHFPRFSPHLLLPCSLPPLAPSLRYLTTDSRFEKYKWQDSEEDLPEHPGCTGPPLGPACTHSRCLSQVPAPWFHPRKAGAGQAHKPLVWNKEIKRRSTRRLSCAGSKLSKAVGAHLPFDFISCKLLELEAYLYSHRK